MKGDREVCLNAGMDGYVSKPLKAEELLATIEQTMAVRTGILPGDPDTTVDKGTFDREEALARVDGDRELFREVMGLFFEDYPATMAEIDNAISEGDGARLNRAAHALKGAVANFGARNAFDLALRLEMMGKGGELGGAKAVFSTLAEEVERLRKALEDFAGGAVP
jgi:HPt (histidine-containing phosphotransfer) domain-containing protein